MLCDVLSVEATVRLERISDSENWRWYRINEAPPSEWYISVTQVLQVAVDDRLRGWLSKTSPSQQEKVKEETSEAGTDLHELIEKSALGQPFENPVPKHQDPAVKAWLKLQAEHKIHADAVEFGVFSPRYGYAGTADMKGTCDGRRALMDIKTGWVGPKVGWQVCAYDFALDEVRGDQGLDVVCIQVKRDGSEANLFKYEHTDWCFDRFIDCLGVWRGLNFWKLKKQEWRWLGA